MIQATPIEIMYIAGGAFFITILWKITEIIGDYIIKTGKGTWGKITENWKEADKQKSRRKV